MKHAVCGYHSPYHRSGHSGHQSGKLIERSTGDTSLNVDGRTVSLWLTQEESLRLTAGVNAEVQINWTYMDSDGVTVRRAATKLKTIPITKQLLKRVIE